MRTWRTSASGGGNSATSRVPIAVDVRPATAPPATLKHSRFLWLRDPRRLSERQRARRERLAQLHQHTGRAYRIKLAFAELYTKSPEQAEAHLRRWYAWAIRSRLVPIIEFAKSVKAALGRCAALVHQQGEQRHP